MLPEINYNCKKCGSCCRLIGFVIKQVRDAFDENIKFHNKTNKSIAKLIAAFPYPTNKDGSCTQLDENNGCKVYKDRPIVCQINEMYQRYYSKTVDIDQHIQNTKNACESYRKVFKL